MIVISLICDEHEIPEDTKTAVVAPGGGLVIAQRKGAQMLVDIMTTPDRVPSIKLAFNKHNPNYLGQWKEDGEQDGVQIEKREKQDGSKKVVRTGSVKEPLDVVKYTTLTGATSDVHQFGGMPERDRTEPKDFGKELDDKTIVIELPVVEVPVEDAPLKEVP